MIEELIEAIEEVCQYEEITEETLVEDLELDSMQVQEVIIIIEDVFDLSIPYYDLESFITIGDASEYLRKKIEE